jgi:ABC-type nitrate/sulfonate/bicarbonate transport system permease component
MVNIPYRSSESLGAERISERLSSMRRTAGAIVLGLVVALLIGLLLSRAPLVIHGVGLEGLVPLDDTAIAAIFTA